VLNHITLTLTKLILVNDQLVGTQDSHPLECIIPDDVLTKFDAPDDEQLLLEICRGVK
jgi:hypothetical protein